MDHITEPARRVPVSHAVDVAVAGGGVSGLFAALAAARLGAKTVLIDRLGSLAGNMGPGYQMGATTASPDAAAAVLPGGLQGIPREFFARVVRARSQPPQNYADAANAISYVAFKMAEEYGLELILSAYAADPVMEGDTAKGIFVEGKSGRVAVLARVVIDGTGDADLAARAGAPMLRHIGPDPSYACLIKQTRNDARFPYYNDGGIYAFVGGVDYARFRQFIDSQPPPSQEDLDWAARHCSGPKVEPPCLPLALVRKEWEAGGFRHVREPWPNVFVSSGGSIRFHDGRGVVGLRGAVTGGQFDTSDMGHISRLEAATRVHAFETVDFLRRCAPGFEQAYLIATSSFLGARGGPCIDAEHVLTPLEAFHGARFDDVLYRNIMVRARMPGGTTSGFDVPYRVAQPKRIEGMLVCGRGAGFIRRGHDCVGMRPRWSMMTLGQAVGTAAALSVRAGVHPKALDVKTLQRELLRAGINLGEEDRLRELGLIDRR